MVSDPLQAVTGIGLLIALIQLFISLLGLAIAYVAYTGYRRYDSKPMLYFCLGFFMLFGPPAAVGLLAGVLETGDEVVATLVTQLSEIAGLVLVFVALRINE
jgi:hypothetical protein